MASKHRNTKKTTTKKKKWVYIVLPIIFVCLVGAIVAICLLSFKSCKKPEEQKTYTVHVQQPTSSDWSLTVNGSKNDLQVKLDDELQVVVSSTSAEAYASIDKDLCYYLQVAPTTETEQETWTNELSPDESGTSYSASFPMAWAYDVTISIITTSDFEESFVVKDDQGQTKYLYDKATLYNPYVEYVTKIDPIKLTTTKVLKSSFGATEDADDDIYVGKNVTKIYPYFLLGCINYNSQIHFNDEGQLKVIEDGFLSGCNKFNKPIVFPDTLIAIKGDFMLSCSDFNQSIDTNKVSDMSECTSFLASALKFNSPITIGSSLKQIPTCFLLNCKSFNQSIEIPYTVEKINDYFLCECTSMVSTIKIECTESAFSYLKNAGHVGSTTHADADCYQQGIKVSGSYKTQWLNTFDEIPGTSGVYRKFVG